MFKKVDERATRVSFWFCALTIDLDGGLQPIRDNVDIKLVNAVYWKLPTMLIYTCSGDELFEKDHKNDRVIASITATKDDMVGTVVSVGKVKDTMGTFDDDEEPEWLKEGGNNRR